MNDAAAMPAPATRPVKFVHEKGAQFRTYHADGAWSVVSASGNIHLNFFVEFPKTADALIAQIQPSGEFGQSQMLGAGELDPNFFTITRDWQCSVVLSLASARVIRDQLDYFIKGTEAQLQVGVEPPKHHG